MIKLDPSWLQLTALAGACAVGVIAASQAQWAIASAALTGLFALLHIPPRGPPNPQP